MKSLPLFFEDACLYVAAVRVHSERNPKSEKVEEKQTSASCHIC